MRLFVAIELPDAVKTQIDSLAHQVATQWPDPERVCRWVKPDQFHLTLKFLGECRDNTLAAIKTALDLTARRHSAFDLRLGKLGSFNKGKSFKVLWLGVEEGAGAAALLAADLNSACQNAGIKKEKASYHPHITLARSKAPFPALDLDKILARRPPRPITPFPASAITLMQSVLSPQGPHYTAQCRIPLLSRQAPEAF